METIFYLVNPDDPRVEDIESINELTDEEFVFEAEAQGNVYSLNGFEAAFNSGDINSYNDFLRIIIN